jgi:phosphoribosylaminoimidazole-succinocarboxamide synthase
MAGGFQGLEGELIPDMTDEFVQSVTARYTELFEAMTGQKFVGRDYTNVQDAMEQNIASAISNI